MLGVLAYGLASAATSVDLSVPSWNERYFSPNGDDQEDTATVLYRLGQSANVTTTVTDDGGARVRTIEDGVSRAGSDACWNNQVTWDARTTPVESSPRACTPCGRMPWTPVGGPGTPVSGWGWRCAPQGR